MNPEMLAKLKEAAGPEELFVCKKTASGSHSLVFVDTGNNGVVFFSNRFVYRMNNPQPLFGLIKPVSYTHLTLPTKRIV